jgi:tetratricopeptide (TPR) repeat protein
VGLDAYYIDASFDVHETRRTPDGLAVNTGHITAMVRTPGGNMGLDFEQLGPIARYRVIDDVEALANFYNNRGYELLERARERGEEPDWTAIADQFSLATMVMPGFARAWSNAGFVAARRGRLEEAKAFYREAIRRDGALAAPRNNLGALLLESGDAAAAVELLETAARLEPGASHIQYNLARARLASGDRGGARKALLRAVDGGDARARQLLDGLDGAPRQVPAG